MKDLRHYQREAINETWKYFRQGAGKAPIIVLPTGTGKSLVLAKMCQEIIEFMPNARIIMATHVQELIEQDYEELIGLWPLAPCGIYSAGLKQKRHNAQILFAGIQSVYNKVALIQWCDFMFIDEAHLVPPQDAGRYRKFIGDLQRINPNMLTVGLTATHYRLGQGYLHTGKGAFFDGVSYEYSILAAIEAGYLSPLISRPVNTEFDVSEVRVNNYGEFVDSDLAKAVDVDEITQAAVNEIVAFGQDRRAWLAFCASVDHAHHVRDAIRAHGYSCEAIYGDMDKGDRRRFINDYKNGLIRCLTNDTVLTVGFNAPRIDLIADMAPTKSTSKYVQKYGRGTRLFAGKTDCMILDFARNIMEHGPIDAVAPKQKGAGAGGDAPKKECPECGSEVFAGLRQCPDCGYEFPPPKIEEKIDRRAAALAVLSTGEPQWFPVKSVSYFKHVKPGKPPSLRVEYLCGLAIHKEWISLEGGEYGRRRAWEWWRLRSETQMPGTVDQALSRLDDLAKPAEISVCKVGKYSEICGVNFNVDDAA